MERIIIYMYRGEKNLEFFFNRGVVQTAETRFYRTIK